MLRIFSLLLYKKGSLLQNKVYRLQNRWKTNSHLLGKKVTQATKTKNPKIHTHIPNIPLNIPNVVTEKQLISHILYLNFSSL